MLFFLLIACSIQGYSQDRNITGKVIDEDNQPLSGVSVRLRDQDYGTVTNENGQYSLMVKSGTVTLVFSYVGMKDLELEVNELASNYEVVMEAEPLGLEEVIAIGYGTAKKKDLTGSVSTVEGADISKRNVAQLSQAIQGAIPGVMVTRSGSTPGAGATVRIRGITTIGDSDPLIIVDGVPVLSMNDVNADDIDDISVLKDAASASIYGARAAAGVILITTKRARKGQVSVEYSGNYGIEKPTRFPEVVGAQRYLEMINEFTWNDAGNVPGEEYALYSKDMVDNWVERNKTDPNQYPVTDWIGLVLKEQAPRTSHNLSVTAGGDKIRTLASLNYEKIDGLYLGKSYERVMSRLNNRITINKYISVDLDMAYNYSLDNNASVNPIESIREYAPIYAATWDDGRIAGGKSGSNIYARINYGGFEKSWRNLFTGRAALEIKPVNNLTITGVFSPQLYSTKGKAFHKQIPYYSAEDPTIFSGYIAGSATTSLEEERVDGKSFVKQLLVNYQKKLSGHRFNLLGGYEDSYTFREVLTGNGDNYVLSDYPYLDIAPLDFRTNAGNAFETSYRSFFGRLMYDFNDRYFLQANIRYDGSSRFHPDYRWGAFPSVSAGWILTNEKFFQNSGILSYLKIRGSWGQLGNERIGNYPYQSSLSFNNALLYQGSTIVSATTAAQTRYAIADISWEVTETVDLGLDAYFFNNRLMLTADYYDKRTKDMLLELEIPDYMGVDNPQQNTGIMYTKGWDLQMSWRDKINKLNYSVVLNISDSRSVMGDLGGIVLGNSQITREGSEYNEWYGYLSEGIFQNAAEVDASPKLYAAIKPGDVKYVDISGPDGVPDGKITPDYDRVLLGGSLPRYIYGGQINAAYGGFDIGIAVQGVGKKNTVMPIEMVKPFFSAWSNPPAIIDGNYWSVNNTEAQNLAARYPRLSYTAAENNNYATSDFWMMSGAYFRLKNISLGYTIPDHLTRNLAVNNIRVHVSATDLFSIDDYPRGWDPEVSSSSYISKSFNFGISVRF
ncbi:TonB-dependent receptor [Niabella terrae]